MSERKSNKTNKLIIKQQTRLLNFSRLFAPLLVTLNGTGALYV